MKVSFFVFLASLLFITTACSRQPTETYLDPRETVVFYLQELAVLKNLAYFDKDSSETITITKESDRYIQAKKRIEELIWSSGTERSDRIRYRTFTSTAMILTYAKFSIIDMKSKEAFAFVTVVFEDVGYRGLDLGKASQGTSRPITYDLIQTPEGWRLKDMNGILAGMGV